MGYEDKICDAITIMVDRAVSEARFDRTIQAIVQECSDASIGKYKVKYQDSSFYAYATSTDVTYSKGSNVYILIPANDMSKDKTILGTVNKLGINYVTLAEGDEPYDYIGTNCIEATSTQIELSSYRKEKQVIYEKGGNANRIQIDETALNEYIKKSSQLICGAFFRTSLPEAQKDYGNYGIAFELVFNDNANREVIRTYIVDVDNMTGDPYNLKTGKRQYGIFNIDGANFKEIHSIYVFVENFPHSMKNQSENAKFDIFISNVELNGAKKMSEEEINGCGISFYTPDGSFFSADPKSKDTLRLIAQVKMKGKLADSKIQKIPFYWFVEDITINSLNPMYNQYGGRGWRCLNKYNVIEGTSDNPKQVEWIPAEDTYIIKEKDIKINEAKYKCVIIYDNNIYEKEIVIKDFGGSIPEYKKPVTIESNLGTRFYYDIGRPTLTCKVNGEIYNNWHYYWVVEDQYGNITNLPIDEEENRRLNEEYNQIIKSIADVNADLKAGKISVKKAEEEIKKYQKDLDILKYKQRVEIKKTEDGNVYYGHHIYNADINKITNFVKYKCAAYDQNNNYRGTGVITLTNKLETEGTYTLIINNGNQNFKYNEQGISPASKALDTPITLSAITFTIFDNLGNALDEDIIKNCKIKWKIPVKDSMLSNVAIDGTEILPKKESNDNFVYHEGGLSLTYEILNTYYYNRKNNDIELIVEYKGTSLTAKTNLAFIKEGDIGTNGTEYLCKIVPDSSSSNLPIYPMFTVESESKDSWKGSWNFNFKKSDGSEEKLKMETGTPIRLPFVIELYSLGKLVYRGNGNPGNSKIIEPTTKGFFVKPEWSILKNKYGSRPIDQDPSNFIISQDEETKYTYLEYQHIKDPEDEENKEQEKKDVSPSNIIKVKVTYGDSTGSHVIYATLPIIVAETINFGYGIGLKPNTGFRYVSYTSDGVAPKYDNRNLFEISLLNNEGEELYLDGETSAYKNFKFTFSRLGQIADAVTKEGPVFKNSEQLKEISVEKKKYQYSCKPTINYDGFCVNNAIKCVVGYTDEEGREKKAKIHIPIHFFLNKYEFAELNEWDGNSIQIDENGGHILAPKIGAGYKEEDNTFTGTVMGKVVSPQKTNADVGLFGYNKGIRSFFIDSKTGGALFGSSNGQIAIDPSANQGMLYSHNFWKEYKENGFPTSYNYEDKSGNCSGKGMLINLTKPEILFGNGNFKVNENGQLTAQAGKIAGWDITNDGLKNTEAGLFITPKYIKGPGFILNGNKSTTQQSRAMPLAGEVQSEEPGIVMFQLGDKNSQGSITYEQGALAIRGNFNQADNVTLKENGCEIVIKTSEGKEETIDLKEYVQQIAAGTSMTWTYYE